MPAGPSAIAVPLVAAVTVSPWVVRNKVELGCYAITTDGRALWKANNANTYKTLSSGLWLDQVQDLPQRLVKRIPPLWVTPEAAGAEWRYNHRVIDVPECAQQSAYEHLVFKFWEHHPGEKVKLAGQATEMLWSPRAGLEGAQEAGVDSLRQWAEPLYTVPLFLLAIAGLFCVPAAFRALAIIFVALRDCGRLGLRGHDALPGAVGLRARVTRRRSARPCVDLVSRTARVRKRMDRSRREQPNRKRPRQPTFGSWPRT